jgi:hypothetical protein
VALRVAEESYVRIYAVSRRICSLKIRVVVEVGTRSYGLRTGILEILTMNPHLQRRWLFNPDMRHTDYTHIY